LDVEAVLRQVVFRTEDREYRWGDVLRAAEIWGEWDGLRRRVAAAIMRLEELESQDAAPTSEDIGAAAEEFRYARDLLTAEDLERWLERWDLPLQDWEDYTRRSLLDPALVESSAGVPPGAGASSSPLEPAVWAEAVCSGALAAWAARLAALAAFAARWREESAPGEGAEPAGEPRPPPRRTGDGGGHSEDAGPEDDAFRRMLAEFESAYGRLVARLVTPQAIADRIARRRADWTCLEGVLLAFDEENQAQEAAMLGREDREPPQVVARTSGAMLEEGRFFLEDLDPAIRELLRGAPRNAWAGPFAAGGRFLLLFIRDKIPPLPTDSGIRRRAERSLLDSLVKQEVSRRVTWCQHP
jgi:hypothetical protein